MIEESGKRYFTEGKIDKKGSSIERNVKRIMLIELPEWKNLKEIYEFLSKNEHYFEELAKKENPFEKIESGEEKKNEE